MDNDGDLDLFAVGDPSDRHFLWINDGAGRFTEEAVSGGAALSGDGPRLARPASFGDYDNDGYLDVFITAIFDPNQQEPEPSNGNGLYRNLGKRQFSQVGRSAGVDDGMWAWGTEFVDIDNDGDLDLAHANGFSVADEANDPFIEPRHRLKEYETDPLRLFRNNGDGTFTDIAAETGFVADDLTHGILPFDYDRDADVDLLVTRVFDSPTLFRNDFGNENDWLKVEVRGVDSTIDGIGARVSVVVRPAEKPQLGEASASATYPCQSSGRTLHFGLGNPSEEPVHAVSVFWPTTGRRRVWRDVERRTTLVAVEPEANASTTTTSTTTTTTLHTPACRESPRDDCFPFERLAFRSDERREGREKLRLVGSSAIPGPTFSVTVREALRGL